MNTQDISRRDFLMKSLSGLGGIVILANSKKTSLYEKFFYLDDFADAEYLARNTVTLPNTLPIRSKPSTDASIVRTMEQDECLPWNRVVIGSAPLGRTNNDRWVETPDGYI